MRANSPLMMAVSLALALLTAALVFLVWFPHPFRELAGGVKLFLIIVAVDVITAMSVMAMHEHMHQGAGEQEGQRVQHGAQVILP